MTKQQLTPTEICLIEVVGMPEFTAAEKVNLVNSYTPVISGLALIKCLELIQLVEELRFLVSELKILGPE